MKLTTIYKDENNEISIFSFVDYILKKICVNFLKISDEELDILLDKGISDIDLSILQQPHIITSSNVPILKKQKYIMLSDQGQIFNDALNYIVDYISYYGKIEDTEKENIKEEIMRIYQHQYNMDCYTDFFEEELFGVTGYMRAIKNNTIILFFFKIE